MQIVNESIRLVQPLPQRVFPPITLKVTPSAGSNGTVLGCFEFTGYLVDLLVQQSEQHPRLRRVGIVNHLGIFSPTNTPRPANRSNLPRPVPDGCDAPPTSIDTILTVSISCE